MILFQFIIWTLLLSTNTLRTTTLPINDSSEVRMLEKAPDFEFILEDGTSKKLSDYKGQVLYISFWASWCAPCLKNFKKYEATRTELEKMGVVLLNISVDQTQEAYKNLLIKQPIIGANAWTSEKARIQEAYELFAVPTYHIITKEGDFYFLGDGSGRDIFGEFRELLK